MNRRKSLWLFVPILSLSLFGSPALADDDHEEVRKPTGGGSAVVAIKKGDRAPFDGQLFPTERAIAIGSKLESCEAARAADMEKAEAEKDIAAKLCLEKRDLALESSKLREEMIKDAYSRPFYEHPMFVAIAASLATYGLLRAARNLP